MVGAVIALWFAVAIALASLGLVIVAWVIGVFALSLLVLALLARET